MSTRTLRTLLLLLAAAVWTTPGTAEADVPPAPRKGGTLQTSHTPEPAPAERAPFEPKVKPQLQVSRSTGPIQIDGVLDDAGWTQAARADGFTEIMPGNQVQPQTETEVLVTYDDHHLYLAFLAQDDPALVRASLRNRDEMFQDDWVGIILDTYGDAAQAYEIFVNPLGIQGDLMMGPGGEDPGFDLIFYSDGRVTQTGYQVEMAIPFSSLRFPDRPEQAWRATFLRNHPRDSRRLYSWATATLGDPCILCQTGTLSGITGVAASTKLEILPALVGYQAGRLFDAEDPAAGFRNERLRPEASLNLRYNLTSSLAAEATVNPDFSQIESDAAQIDVNSTFALFYPERRPFFQAGSDLFQTEVDVVYTRSINDPVGAAKVTGRMGRTSLAFLSALDEHTPVLLPFAERSELVEAGRSLSNILRARRTFGENSYVGTTLTDRRLLDGGGGTAVSADLGVQFLKNYTLSAQLALSDTQEPERTEWTEDFGDERFGDGYTAAFDGERFQGYGLYAGLSRGARHWGFDLSYRGYSPTFRTANGFVTRNSFHTLGIEQRYSFYPKWDFVDRLTPGVELQRHYDFDGGVKESRFAPQLFLMMKGQTFVFAGYDFWNERFKDTAFEGLRSWMLNVNSTFSQVLGGGFYVSGGQDLARFEDIPEVGRQRNAGARLTIQPLQRLVLQPSVNYASLRDPETDETFFSGYILRIQTNLQFTRELSARLITQYDDFSDRLGVEPLVSYQLNPFSIFYVGSTHGFDRFSPPYGFTQSGRQLFFKFQYLFRT